MFALDGAAISGGNPGRPTFYATDRITNSEPATTICPRRAIRWL
jgi:hypothetical protein